jgi:iron-sulfur cluster assembly accessory protein
MITLTDTATSKVGQLLEAEGAEDLALRVAVRPGGCSGFSYEMFFDGDFAADDNVTNFGDDGKVRVVVDAASASRRSNARLQRWARAERLRRYEPQRNPLLRLRPEFFLSQGFPISASPSLVVEQAQLRPRCLDLGKPDSKN